MSDTFDEFPEPPDGISRTHIEPGTGLHRHASVLSLVVLGTLLLVGLTGYLGETREVLVVDAAAGRFEIDVPTVVRSGNVIETRVRIEAKKDIEDLVIGVDPGFWRNITTNSIAPNPASEGFVGGLWRFSFDQGLASGDAFELQISQQVNPSLVGTNRGHIIFFDHTTRLAGRAVSMKVLP